MELKGIILERYTNTTLDEFDAYISILKRKADKHLLEEYTSNDIDKIVSSIKEDQSKLEEGILSLYEELNDEILSDESNENINESLKMNIDNVTMENLFQMPLARFNACLNPNDLAKEAREREKQVNDFKFLGIDGSLTINKMKAYILIHGNNDEKELIGDKIDSLERFIARCKNSKKEKFELAYGSVRSIYSLYKRVNKKVEKRTKK